MIKVNILRKKADEYKRYFQCFNYDGEINIPVTVLLDNINKQNIIKDVDGNVCDPIVWECSCQQGLCGACAMVINNKPVLACKTFCNELLKDNDEITIEPLSKFPCIEDLKVDRSEIFKAMEDMKLWLDEEAEVNLEEVQLQYKVSQCLMCGCCLEACVNYAPGMLFKGPAAAAASLKVAEQLKKGQHKAEVLKKYKKEIFNGCSKSLACQEVCPMKIPLVEVMSKMNRYSVWGLWKLINRRTV